MGAGRKTQTIHASERIQHFPARTNSNPTGARLLKKKDLGGVIFGCTHFTMNECIVGLIFGLPEVHFSYIKNVMPGMPLFLFNYSDRKLHGIFEAAGHGRLNINPHAWTENGSGMTQFPAQVRVRIRKKCKSLSEDAFREILPKNSNTQDSKNYFQFELDHKQTSQLISLFECSPVATPAPSLSCNTQKVPEKHTIMVIQPVATPAPSLSCNTPKLPEKHTTMVTQPVMGPNIDQSYEDEDSKLLKEACCQHLKLESECQSDLSCPSRRNWASLFKENSAHGASKVVGAKKSQMPELSSNEKRPVSFSSNTDSGSPCFTFGWEVENQITGTYPDKVTVRDEENIIDKVVQVAFDCSLEEHVVAADTADTVDTCSIYQLRKELEELKAFSTEQLRKTSELEKKLVAIEKSQAGLEQRSEPLITEEWELTGLDGMIFSES